MIMLLTMMPLGPDSTGQGGALLGQPHDHPVDKGQGALPQIQEQGPIFPKLSNSCWPMGGGQAGADSYGLVGPRSLFARLAQGRW